MPAYRPTRICPHRWCPHTHLVMVAVLVIGILGDVLSVPTLAVPLLVLAAVLHKLVESILSSGNLQLSAAGARVSEVLVARPGWARAAIVADILMLAWMVQIAVDSLTAAHGRYTATLGRALLAITLSALTVGTTVYLHWQATRPGRADRVTVPATI